MEEKSVLDNSMINTINERLTHEKTWNMTIDTNLFDERKLRICKKNIDKQSLYDTLTKQIHNGDISNQGKPMSAPIDLCNTGYKYILKLNRINETNITEGIIKHVNDEKWLHGLIAYNDNSILVRGGDNEYGMPGPLYCIIYYDGLSIEIMNRYIIPNLVSNINKNKYDTKSDPKQIIKEILNLYSDNYFTKLDMLNNNKEITEAELFSDAPPKEELIKHMTDEERKIHYLENRVDLLESQLDNVMSKLNEIEDILLDVSISKYTKNSDITEIEEFAGLITKIKN